MHHDQQRMRKGQPVRVKFATQDGFLWHSASVVRDDEDGLTVEFASGMKKKVRHGEGRYERVNEDA